MGVSVYIKRLGQALTSISALIALFPGLVLWQSRDIGVGNYYDKAGQLTFAVIAQLLCLLCVSILILNRISIKSYSRTKISLLISFSGAICIIIMFSYVFWIRPMNLVTIPPNTQVDPERVDTVQFIYPVHEKISIGAISGTISSCALRVRFREIESAIYQSKNFRLYAISSALLIIVFYCLSFIGLIVALMLSGMALLHDEESGPLGDESPQIVT